MQRAHDRDDNLRDISVLPRDVPRRHVLQLLGGGALLALVGCSSNDGSTMADTADTTGTTGATRTPDTVAASATSATTGAAASDSTAAVTTDAGAASVTTAADEAASCTPIPEETAGPFPGNGSNGPNVLTESEAVRSDITASFGSSSTVAQGVPLTVTLAITDLANGCAALPGAAVYIWHCDRDGRYSMYSAGVTEENYLRGVQEAGADGTVTFQTIFPGAYQGRWPHIHFEDYASLADATSGGEPMATSQIALPPETCDVVFATAGYETSVRNHASTSLESDNVFGEDGGVDQIPTVAGDPTSGITALLAVAV